MHAMTERDMLFDVVSVHIKGIRIGEDIWVTIGRPVP